MNKKFLLLILVILMCFIPSVILLTQEREPRASFGGLICNITDIGFSFAVGLCAFPLAIYGWFWFQSEKTIKIASAKKNKSFIIGFLTYFALPLIIAFTSIVLLLLNISGIPLAVLPLLISLVVEYTIIKRQKVVYPYAIGGAIFAAFFVITLLILMQIILVYIGITGGGYYIPFTECNLPTHVCNSTEIC